LKQEEDQEFMKKKEGKLPLLLELLVIHGCHSILSLHLIFDYPSVMSELQFTNCSRLMYIEGLRDLTNLPDFSFFLLFKNCFYMVVFNNSYRKRLKLMLTRLTLFFIN
jgi:hypothetical protein